MQFGGRISLISGVKTDSAGTSIPLFGFKEVEDMAPPAQSARAAGFG
jgi:hypothetical protein